MAVVAISDSILSDIADAIRSKNGTSNTYKPSQMPDAIEAISGGGITPTGTIEITQNGIVDVTNYASADVDVPSETPTLGTKTITQNGTYDAEDDSLDGYSEVTVNVSGGITPTGTKQISITQNGTTTEDVTNYANAEITVNVPSSSSGIRMKTFTFTAGGGTSNTVSVDIDTSKVLFVHFYDPSAVYTTANTTYEGFRMGPALTKLSAVLNSGWTLWRTNSAGTTTGYYSYGSASFGTGTITVYANPQLTSGNSIQLDVFYTD